MLKLPSVAVPRGGCWDCGRHLSSVVLRMWRTWARPRSAAHSLLFRWLDWLLGDPLRAGFLPLVLKVFVSIIDLSEVEWIH